MPESCFDRASIVPQIGAHADSIKLPRAASALKVSMAHLINWIEFYGLTFVFFNVLVSQAGVPIPAVPTLVMAGALIIPIQHSFATVAATALLGAIAADLAWYYAGGRFGRTVLRAMCRISLSPDSCVRHTESIYTRFGPPSLLIAKFIPGFAAVATAMAGALRTPLGLFVLCDAIGALLWVSVPLYAGMLFRDAVASLLVRLDELGHIGLLIILVALALFVVAKWWQRYRFIRELRMARISVGELQDLLTGSTPPVILDVRSAASQVDQGRIPGSITVTDATVLEELTAIPHGNELVVYCACPNEASAAHLAKLLMRRGYERVRPLAGGIDAWVAAGYSVEH